MALPGASDRGLPPLPGVTPDGAPSPDDPGYADWVEDVGFTADGVDRGLIWASLHRSPAERLATLERAVSDLLELRGGRWPEIR
jgi:hypothetical protein